MSKNYEISCEYCGKDFVAHNIRRGFCCKRCKDNASKVRRGIEPTVIHKRICLGCGKEFETQFSRKVYCKKGCGKYDMNMTHTGERECIICGKIFFTCHNAKTCGNIECKKAAKKLRSQNWAKPRPKLITYETRECKECGEIFSIDKRLNNVYCSADCRRKAENRKKDKRIPREQIVDTDISLKRLFKRDNGICWICGEKCDFDSTSVSQKGNVICGDLYPEIEHVVPISRGGLHSWANVRLAHHKCNAQKGADMYPYVPLDLEFAYKEKRTGTQPKKTAQYTLEGELVRIWESTAAIEREHKEWKCKYIQSVCRGYNSRTGNAYGYHWEYVKDDKCE